MTRLAPSLALAAVAMVGTAATASAHGQGHTPIVVCHNVTHNPHIIVVDDDSTKLHAHLAHRTQSQLMDLVEGLDGTAAQIRAACVPAPTPTTVPTTATPSPTTTGSTPSPTSTTTPATSTTATRTTTAPSPSPTSSTPTTAPTGPSSSTSHGSTSSRPPIASTASLPSTATSPRRSVPSSTVAPPELAHTGAGLGLAAIGAALTGAGIALSRKVRRGQH